MKKYFSLVVFSHTIFALPFAVLGFMLAYKQHLQAFDILLFLKMLFCMVSARTAAMAFNRYADADIDAINKRTAVREIPSGQVSKSTALLMVVISSALFVLTTYYINNLCFYLSPVALVVILGYSYTKRFTPLAHLILGLGLALAPIGAYLSVSASFAWLPVILSIVVLFWVSGFDIIYALQDESFDRENHLHSIPAWLGAHRALKLSKLFHIISASLLVVAGIKGNFSILYFIGVALFIVLLYYQHSIVKANDLSRVNRAFFTTNGIASVLFAILAICDLLFLKSH
jgi:4-hydroxybenzoate polyprenyltransferase